VLHTGYFVGLGFAFLVFHVHLDIKYLPQIADESKRRYLFAAIDRATHLGQGWFLP
jgi:hypothetical protein